MFLKMVTLFTCQPYRSHVFWCPLIWPSHCRIFVTCKCVVQLKFRFGTQLLGFFFFLLSFSQVMWMMKNTLDIMEGCGMDLLIWERRYYGPRCHWLLYGKLYIKERSMVFFFSLNRIIYKPIMVIVDWVKFDLCIVSYQNGARGFQEQIMGCIEQNTWADSCHVVLLI